MRSHLEVDPVIGVKGIEAVLPLIEDYRWAIDLEICVFPQEGLTDNPGTDELMVEAMRRGARVVGGCPYTDSDPKGPDRAGLRDRPRLRRRHRLPSRFRHQPRGHDGRRGLPAYRSVRLWRPRRDRPCQQAFGAARRAPRRRRRPARRRRGRGDRAAVDRSLLDGRRARPRHRARRRAGPPPGRGRRQLRAFDQQHAQPVHAVRRRLDAAHGQPLRQHRPRRHAPRHGRMPAHGHRPAGHADARRDYGIRVGNPADIVVLDCATPEAAVQTLAAPLCGFKRGRRTFTRAPAVLHRP